VNPVIGEDHAARPTVRDGSYAIGQASQISPLTIDLNWRIKRAMIDIRANITCTYFWAYR